MLRARHSWSMDHVFDGLAEAAEQDEPIQLFHGTTWKAWAGIGRSCLKSEQQLKGGTGRIHVHLARTPFSVRPGSEVIICINTQTLFKLAKGYRMPVLANEKAVYIGFPLPLDSFATVCVASEAGIRVPRDRWVLDKKALETGEPEEAQEPREATKGEASGSKSHSEDAAGAPEATSSKGETKAVDKSGVSQDKPPPEAAVKEEPAVAV